MHLDELDYDLPPTQIAQRPLPRREASRMLDLHRATGKFVDRSFQDFASLLRGGELLVLNNARVIPARLFGRRLGTFSDPPSRATRREHLTGSVEVLLTKRLEADVWEALVRPGRKMKVGEGVVFGDGQLEAEILARGQYGVRTVRFHTRGGESTAAAIERLGRVPLPPYIDREDESGDRERYQTVYAKQGGAVAAPTAGLHFTTEILAGLRQRGVQVCEITLDVGLGTFQPIHSERLEDHQIHTELYEIPEATVTKIDAAEKAGRRIVAVGTTVVRALEDAAAHAAMTGSDQLVSAGRRDARLFITPGFHFRVVNALLTNFHLPRSTLLALVCAFAGREYTLGAYHHAVKAGYRFYSYGDCMFIR